MNILNRFKEWWNTPREKQYWIATENYKFSVLEEWPKSNYAKIQRQQEYIEAHTGETRWKRAWESDFIVEMSCHTFQLAKTGKTFGRLDYLV